ncbi:single-stranded-DNA-specific exonuclease RecJ [Nitrosomonas halophila]|jgi:single-stranded-DNA-specific exonuclease|uniref:Single-stranded-DNA-specific exonuclease RecJ n=1 Tax=Nitrosomonas halophila TaxID=44576 RepID=A0A1H3GXF6_9PROT|nr:single-stranded-DNA-specific exonuclease RecJ [Nitrosomonas halophila]SDY07655.1 single-stranded-DNA-specific exonuclease [Nitrosomonas halophila]
MVNIVVRQFSPHAFEQLSAHGLPPVLARIFAARGIGDPVQLDTAFVRMAPFEQLKNISLIARLLADAIAARKRMLIVADYDSDGATACAVALRALRQFGAVVDYLVPNRFEYGYGLTPEIVRLAANRDHPPDILITVDNGIASVEGVEAARQLGMQVYITDHHLPGDRLPDAAVIVNPNQPGCDFPDKHIAGVGVIFYVMLALRAEMRARGVFGAAGKEPNLANLLDLVALGTVADVVRLDGTNRILVQQGLQRIRNGRCCAGLRALLKVAGRDLARITTYELGFILAPRLNAAGRLDDMSLGIECLMAEDAAQAMRLATELDELNRQRREIEAGMREEALDKLMAMADGHGPAATTMDDTARSDYSLCLYDSDWHQGVIGLIASRIKEKLHRPVLVFAPGNAGEIKGSGRSIPGFHLRDALDLVAKRHPGLIVKFGGHAMAAGLTIHEQNFEWFRTAFEHVAQTLLTPADLIRVIETDGELAEDEMSLELAQRLASYVWGQGFPEPSFNGCFHVESQRIVGERHLKLTLSTPGGKHVHDAIFFFHTESLPAEIDVVYRLQANEYNGNIRMQLLLEHWFETDRSAV